jgi:alcohol dehydrogenase
MRSLRRFLSPEFVFGSGARLVAGRYALSLGSARPLVVSDAGVTAAGWTAEVMTAVEADGLEPVLYAGVTPNPKAHEVMAGAELYQACACDVIIAVGGGSVIDCAKGIGVVAANGGHILDYTGIDNIPSPGPPLICIPTTAGSAADMSQFAVITDPERPAKMAIMSKAVVPDISLVDPVTTTTCDPRLTASCGLDAFTHAIEAFVSRAGSAMVDLHAIEAIGLLRQALPSIAAEPKDLGTRETLMRAAMHAGLAFSNASLGAAHAMSHPLGAGFGIPHGEANALMIDHVVAFNFPEVPDRYCRIGDAMGLHLAGLDGKRQIAAIGEDIRRLKAETGLDRTLRDWGVSRGELGELAARAAGDICLVTNPRTAGQGDLEVLYAEAL